MSYVRVSLMVPLQKEQELEEALKQVELVGMAVVHCRGYGSHPNFYFANWTMECAMFEIFLVQEHMEQLKQKIKSVCPPGSDSEGIAIVSDVREIQRVSDI
ncbi:P-II family nitrogen regulator [Hahella ganghwensis]|uniref:P-II family nitrogen regulator n=1 Tax=Hahella ganghwensis TaxID=286420 RepID=UPI0003612751|nr:hypothetical protein [Hahella ganghwensis]